jgi:hypothetical protein
MSESKEEKNVTKEQELVGEYQQQQQEQEQQQQQKPPQFPIDMESPIWDRQTLPVTEKEDPRKELERSNSKWIYGLKGEILVIRCRTEYSSISVLNTTGSWFNHPHTKFKYKRKKEYRMWSVHLYSGIFDIHKDWKILESDYYPIFINNNKDDDNIVMRSYQWLDMKLKRFTTTRSKKEPLWIVIEKYDLNGILAHNIQYHIAKDDKCFLESERPIFIVPLEFCDTAPSYDAQNIFDQSGFEVTYDIYENPAATFCYKTCKNIKKWNPPNVEKKERKRRWVISLYGKDDFYDLEKVYPLARGTMYVACTLDVALNEAFRMHGEKYPMNRIGQVLAFRPGHSISLIQKKRTRQNPQSGRLQLYYYMLKLDSLKLRFENLYRDARAETRTVVDDIMNRSIMMDDFLNPTKWRSQNKIMQAKKEIDDLLPTVRLEHQERAVKMLRDKKKPKEELWFVEKELLSLESSCQYQNSL